MDPQSPARRAAVRAEAERRQQEEDARARDPVQRGAYRAAMTRKRAYRIQRLQKKDLKVERDLLFSGPNPIKAIRKFDEPWLISQDMRGQEGYILQDLADLLRASLPEDNELVKMAGDNLISARLPGLNDTLALFKSDPRDKIDYVTNDHSGNLMLRVSWLKNIAEDPHAELWPGEGLPAGTRSIWDNFKPLFLLIDRLYLLFRFTDPRNPEIKHKPVADGTNIEDGTLRASWVLHRAWIRSLHYRSLFIAHEMYGWSQIVGVLKLVYFFFDMELALIGGDRAHRPEFTVLADVYASLGHAFTNFVNDLFQETRPIPKDQPYTDKDTVLYNAQSNHLEALWEKHFLQVGTSRKWMLWNRLFEHEDRFNSLMMVEHVEDVLINKRIVEQDEPFNLHEILDGTARQPDLQFIQLSRLSALTSDLKNIQVINRQRRNFLLLRDWSKRRPWKQLYYVFNTETGEGDHLRDSIEDFYATISRLETIDPPVTIFGLSPSRPSNIFSSLFVFHPIASHSPAPLVSCNYADGCTICACNFEAEESVVRLHCNHLFHYLCIRNYWDMPGQYTMPCPNCRATASMLHETAGITPEVLDVFDNDLVTGVVFARNHPDFTRDNCQYMQREHNYRQSSRRWGSVQGSRDEQGPRSL